MASLPDSHPYLMSTPLSRPPSLSRPAQQAAPSKPPYYLLLLLLALSAGTTTIAWMTRQDVLALKTQLATRPTVSAGPVAAPTAGNFTAGGPGGGNFGGGPGGQGGQGGRRGGLSVANLVQGLGLNLDAAAATQLQGLIDQRSQLQQDARAQGYPADTSALDDQIAGLLGMDPQQLQPFLGGGRRGGGGNFGGGGGG